MPRDIPVGNGSFLITFDGDYCIRDVYYPRVGKENHTEGHRFRFGLWADGLFRWVDQSWVIRLDYAGESLLTHASLANEDLSISLDSNDIVDYRENIYLRRILLKNTAGRERKVRLFFHHDFRISGSALGDTAYYDPDERAIIHYKADRYFLISGMRGNVYGIDHFATGRKEFQGLEGTWRDAEDGALSGNPISQGSVDSVLSLEVVLPARGESTLYYWIVPGKDYAEVSRLNRMVLGHGPEYFMRRTDNYWRAWVNKEEFNMGDLPKHVVDMFKKSLLILRTNIDAGGAIIAGNDSDIQHFARDTYSYMWPRDGALTAYALDMAGYIGITRRFFDFCLSIISKGKESVGYFLHKYNPDGSLGSSWHPWTADGGKQLPIQEDGTGLILWALWFHFDRFRDIEFTARQYENLVIRCGDFLASYRDSRTGLPLPSYDLWEENWGVHTFTVSAVYAGLRAAEKFAAFFGDSRRKTIYGRAAAEIRAAMDKYLYSGERRRFLKSLIPKGDGSFSEDQTIDASIYAPFYFGAFEADDERVENTMQAVKERLWVKTEVGGVARYEKDAYFKVTDEFDKVPGNPWFICTLWLAQWQTAKAKTPEELKEALTLIEWACRRGFASCVLAEQVHPFTNRPLSVSPLTWSHATYVAAVLEYLRKLENIRKCPVCGGPLFLGRTQTSHIKEKHNAG